MVIIRLLICWFLIGLGYWFFSVRRRRRNQLPMTKRLVIWVLVFTPLATWLLPGIVLQSFYLGIFLTKVAAGLAGVLLVLGLILGALYLVLGRISWKKLKKR